MSKFTSSEGWLCLDFANTLKQDHEGNDIETLEHYADLVAWGRQYKTIPTDEKAAVLLRAAERQPEAAQAVLEKTIRLRQVIFRLFSAQSGERLPNACDVDEFNQFLPEALVRMRLYPAGEYCNWQCVDAGDNLDQVWWHIVWSAATLLNSETLSRVRECASETCRWLFVDTSRNHSRRWCSMESCGNRDKVRRYLQRQKQ